MNLKKIEFVMLGMVLIAFALGIYFYPQMPERVASHWNARGEVDGYMSKFWGMFLLPIILVPMVLLFIAIPRIDPLKANIAKFRKYFDGFITLLTIFLLAIYLQTILWNKGMHISPNITFPIGLGLLFFYIGILCDNAKRNWFIGIRTPWTLSNEKVWEKTHRLGGKLFKIAGVLALIGVFFRSLALFFVLVPVILVAVFTIVYSYFAYQKETKGATT
ncbi:MAG: SdpI family protein [candidate division KSB1 bacterium]|nr:SdpI family protein [candidate division KSB1 bacterium]MDZ7302834.1 SdpI family protein [candidate division KSB1 bacterium]